MTFWINLYRILFPFLSLPIIHTTQLRKELTLKPVHQSNVGEKQYYTFQRLHNRCVSCISFPHVLVCKALPCDISPRNIAPNVTNVLVFLLVQSLIPEYSKNIRALRAYEWNVSWRNTYEFNYIINLLDKRRVLRAFNNPMVNVDNQSSIV